MGLSQRDRARSRSSLGRSSRRVGGGASGEGAAVEAEARRRERRRGGVDISRGKEFYKRPSHRKEFETRWQDTALTQLHQCRAKKKTATAPWP